MRTLALLLLLAACPSYSKPATPRPMTTPMPIVGLNSPHDDFNAADMSPLRRHTLVFATNRGSQGHDYDLYQADIWWDWVEESSQSPTPFSAREPRPFAPQLMSDANERGPIAIDTGRGEYSFVLASDRSGGLGGLDLYAVECAGWKHSEDVPCASARELRLLTALSSPGDDAYLSAAFADHQLLFASNRDSGSQMDIYTARWTERTKLDDKPAAIDKLAALSSTGDDTAPYVYAREGETAEVVFVSNRPGGLGEHDIYCARFAAGRWTPPVNLGSTFNSARDEYRPIVIKVNKTQFLIFSSTREGGQGGYDLYVVGYRGCPPR
jgi:hypothetical protein